MPVIETKKLTKSYGQKNAVHNLNLEVSKGSVFGFLGPNGAGKTTTLRMLVGLARPTSGDAWVLGESILSPSRDCLRRIGFLPDVPGFYDWMRAPEFLALVGEIFGISGSALRTRVGEVLDLTGLAGIKTRIGGFSRGMKQRLGMAQALINRPELLFLDEPTSALDPMGRRDVLEAIQRLAETTTVFFSTHILSDVERVCDTVAVLNDGHLVTEQRISDLRTSYSARFIHLELEEGADLKHLLQGQNWVKQVELLDSGYRVEPSDLAAAQQLLPAIVAQNGFSLRRFELVEPSLEDIFVRLVNGK